MHFFKKYLNFPGSIIKHFAIQLPNLNSSIFKSTLIIVKHHSNTLKIGTTSTISISMNKSKRPQTRNNEQIRQIQSLQLKHGVYPELYRKYPFPSCSIKYWPRYPYLRSKRARRWSTVGGNINGIGFASSPVLPNNSRWTNVPTAKIPKNNKFRWVLLTQGVYPLKNTNKSTVAYQLWPCGNGFRLMVVVVWFVWPHHLVTIVDIEKIENRSHLNSTGLMWLNNGPLQLI